MPRPVHPTVTTADWTDPSGRSTSWAAFLRSVEVHVPATSSRDTNPTIKAMRQLLAETKAARPHDCPHTPGGYDGNDGTPRAFYAVLSRVPPAVVERVRALRLPAKAEVRTW